MGGKEGGEYSVLLNGISAVFLTAKVRTPCDWRLKGVGKKSWDLSEGGQVMVSSFIVVALFFYNRCVISRFQKHHTGLEVCG